MSNPIPIMTLNSIRVDKRMFVKDGALILAEIERLDRIEARKKGAEHGE